jgi:hypothetical protein
VQFVTLISFESMTRGRSGLALGDGSVKSVGRSALRPADDPGQCQLDSLTCI